MNSEHTPHNNDVRRLVDTDKCSNQEKARDIFSIWFSSSIKGERRRKYRVPAKIEWLPCGCSRERTNEGDVNNTWHILQKNNQYLHKECGKVIE